MIPPSLKHAAYLALALHFLRRTMRKIRPSSRRVHGKPIAEDMYIVAFPRKSRTIVPICKLVAGEVTDRQVDEIMRELSSQFDRCVVNSMDGTDFGYFVDPKAHWERLDYINIPLAEQNLVATNTRKLTPLITLKCILGITAGENPVETTRKCILIAADGDCPLR